MTKKICSLDKNYELRVGPFNFIITGPGGRWYYPDLSAAFEDLLDETIKVKLSKTKKAEMKEILKAVEEARKDIKGMVKGLEDAVPEAVLKALKGA